MTDDRHGDRRLRKAFASTLPGDAPTKACPPAATLWEAANGELQPGELRSILEHVASCSTCTEAWRLASAISGEAAERPVDARSTRRVTAARVGWSAAAAAAAGFLAFTLIYEGMAPGASLARQVANPEAALHLITQPGDSAPSECRASWTPFEGATYDVTLLTAELEPLDESLDQRESSFLIRKALLVEAGADSLRLHVRVRRGLEGVVRETTFDIRCDG